MSATLSTGRKWLYKEGTTGIRWYNALYGPAYAVVRWFHGGLEAVPKEVATQFLEADLCQIIHFGAEWACKAIVNENYYPSIY